MGKLNCWEFMKCGREIGGKNADKLGVCPAASEKKANGIHGGANGGRCCWVIAGTFCEGKVQGTFAEKFEDCTKCPFYQFITEEEAKYLTVIEVKKIIEK